MENRSYLLEWNQLKDKNLLHFFNNLSQKGWDEMMADCVKEDMSSLGCIVHIPKEDTLYTYLLPIWTGVLSETRYRMKCSLNALLESCEEDEYIQLVLYVAAFLEIALNETSIEQVAKNKSCAPLTRAIAADMMTTNMRIFLENFWESINLSQEKFFLSGYVSFYQFINPMKGLEKLQTLDVQPENLSEYEIPVKGALLNVLRHPSWQKRLSDMVTSGKCPKWLKKYIYEIVSAYDVLEPILNESFPRSLKIGISPFPDLMALDYLSRRNLFEEHGLKIKVLYYEWSELFTKLKEGEIDVILANKEVYEEKNKEQEFRYWFDFNKNEGLRIITRMPLENTMRTSCRELLERMMHRRIAVTRDSDHLKVIQSLIHGNGLGMHNFIWKEVSGVFRTLDTFLKDESIEFYIGGMMETEYAIKYKGCLEFISGEDIYSRKTAQYNGCISKVGTNKKKEIRQLEDIWYANDTKHLINYKRLYGLWERKAKQFGGEWGNEVPDIRTRYRVDSVTGADLICKKISWSNGYA